MSTDRILLGKGTQPVHLLARCGNRHRLVAGATGTGKTVSLMVMAEGLSRLGVPVFLADVKGDVAGLAMPGIMNDKVKERVTQTGVEGYASEASPVVFSDLYGKAGHPVRTTVSEMGPSLLARILVLNDTQSGVLGVYFCSQFPDDVPDEILGQLAIACSMRYARTRRATRRPSARRRGPSCRIRRSTSPTSSRSSVSGRRSSPRCRRKVCRRGVLGGILGGSRRR